MDMQDTLQVRMSRPLPSIYQPENINTISEGNNNMHCAVQSDWLTTRKHSNPDLLTPDNRLYQGQRMDQSQGQSFSEGYTTGSWGFNSKRNSPDSGYSGGQGERIYSELEPDAMHQKSNGTLYDEPPYQDEFINGINSTVRRLPVTNSGMVNMSFLPHPEQSLQTSPNQPNDSFQGLPVQNKNCDGRVQQNSSPSTHNTKEISEKYSQIDLKTIMEYDKERKRVWQGKALFYLVVVLCGLIYLAIGIGIGFYWGKQNGSSDGMPIIAAAVETSNNTGKTTANGISTKVPNTSTDDTQINNSLTANVTLPITTTTTKLVDITTTTTATTTSQLMTTDAPLCLQENNTCICGPFGGSHGKKSFNDKEFQEQNGKITGFLVKHNDYMISSLKMKYGSEFPSEERGYSSEGFETKVDFKDNEVIRKVEVQFTCGKSFLSQITFHTNLQTLGPYGGEGFDNLELKGDELMYISGQTGPLVDELTFYFNQCS